MNLESRSFLDLDLTENDNSNIKTELFSIAINFNCKI